MPVADGPAAPQFAVPEVATPPLEAQNRMIGWSPSLDEVVADPCLFLFAVKQLSLERPCTHPEQRPQRLDDDLVNESRRIQDKISSVNDASRCPNRAQFYSEVEVKTLARLGEIEAVDHCKSLRSGESDRDRMTLMQLSLRPK
jgi:hypothetical protein